MEYQSIEALTAGSTRFDVFVDPDDASALDALAETVARGLHPPLPVSADAGGNDHTAVGADTVMWGWPIIREAKRQGLQQLPVAPLDVSNREAVHLMLRLEGRTGRYSWREVAALRRLCRDLAVEIDEELSRQVTGDAAFSVKAERFGALPAALQGALQEALIDLRTAESLAHYASGDPATLQRILDATRSISFSRRRQVLRLALENARRETAGREARDREAGPPPSAATSARSAQTPAGTDLGDVLAEMVHEAAAAPDPVDALMRRRYPKLTALSDRFESIRTEVLNGTGVRLTPPPYFEGDRFEVAFSFATAEELARKLAALDSLKARTGELQDLL